MEGEDPNSYLSLVTKTSKTDIQVEYSSNNNGLFFIKIFISLHSKFLINFFDYFNSTILIYLELHHTSWQDGLTVQLE
jgi:hypothetical protein